MSETAATLLTGVASTSEVRVGTAAELNARSYELVEGYVGDIVVGTNFISGFTETRMRRILHNPDDEPEEVNVVGTFTAVSK